MPTLGRKTSSPPPDLNGRLGEATFTGVDGKEEDAPMLVVRVARTGGR
jgi:hypothetical protein